MARIGIVGAGNIIGQYFDTFDRLPNIEVVALAAGHLKHAGSVAEPRGLRALPTAELLMDPEIEKAMESAGDQRRSSPLGMSGSRGGVVFEVNMRLASSMPVGPPPSCGRTAHSTR